MKDFFTSSTGQGIALRVKAGIPLVVFVLGLFGYQTSEAELAPIPDLFLNIFVAAGIIISGVYEVFGIARAVYNKEHGLGKYARKQFADKWGDAIRHTRRQESNFLFGDLLAPSLASELKHPFLRAGVLIESLIIKLGQMATALTMMSIALAAPQPPYTQVPREPEYETQASIRTLISNMAKAYGVSQVLALELGWIESQYVPTAENPISSAKGLFQFIDSTWKHYCRGDRIDPYDNTRCAMERLADGELWHWTSDKDTKRKLQEAGLL